MNLLATSASDRFQRPSDLTEGRAQPTNFGRLFLSVEDAEAALELLGISAQALPSQTGHGGEFLTNDGAGFLSWTAGGRVTSVASLTGIISADAMKTALSLDQVNNISDANKPISAATATALSGKADLLDGVVLSSQLPSFTLDEIFTVASQAEMLALDARRGDLAIRTDLLATFILAADDASQLASWKQLPTPTDSVLSINGHTGVIVLGASDVGAQPVDSDLTAIAGLTTTSFGRSFLSLVDAAGTRSYIGAGTSNFDGTFGALSGVPNNVTNAISSISVSSTLYVDSGAVTGGVRGRLDKPFPTLAAAVAAASAGDLIKILSDLAYSTAVTLALKVILDGNGHKITTSAQGSSAKIIINAAGCVVQNLEFDGLWDGVSTTSNGSVIEGFTSTSTLRNIYIHDSADEGIGWDGNFSDCVTENIRVVNCRLSGVFFNSQNTAVTNPSFYNISVTNAGLKGIGITRGGAESNQVYGVTLQGFYVNGTVATSSAEGIYLHGLTDFSIGTGQVADAANCISLDSCNHGTVNDFVVRGGRSDQYAGLELAWCQHITVTNGVLDGTSRSGSTSSLGTGIVASTLSGLGAPSAAGPFTITGVDSRGGWQNALSMTYVFGVNIAGGLFSGDKIGMAFTACGKVQVTGATLETASTTSFTVPLNIDSGAASNDAGYSSVGLNRNYQFIGNFFNASSGATKEVSILSQSATDTISGATFKSNKKLDSQSFATPISSSSSGGGSVANVIIDGNTAASGWNNDNNIKDANGNPVFAWVTTASAVNYLSATNSATGNDVVLSATGADSNIGIILTPKGTGGLRLLTNGFTFGPAGSSNHLIDVNPSNTGHIILRSGGLFEWSSSSTNSNAAPDLAFGRNAVGVAEINSGAAGVFRDLKLRDLTLSGLTASSFVETDASKVLVSKTAAQMRTDLGLSALATTTPGTGIATFLATPSSANLAAAVTDEVGYSTGAKLVFNQGPTIYDNAATPKKAVDLNARVFYGTDGTTEMLNLSSLLQINLFGGDSVIYANGITNLVPGQLGDATHKFGYDIGAIGGIFSPGDTNLKVGSQDGQTYLDNTGFHGQLHTTDGGFDLIIAPAADVLTADRTLTLNMGNVAHTLAFGTTANTITFPNAASGTVPFLNLAQTWTAAQTNSTSGAASTPAMKYSGVPFAGTGTTSFPLVYINDANATASTTLNTAGTYFGVNGDGTQDLMNLLKDGTSMFKVASTGTVTQGGKTTTYNNIATEGNGLGAIVKATRVTAQTAANSSIATYTTPASDGSYLISGNINVTAAIAISTSLNCDYTDETNTARTMIIPISGLGGTFLAGGLATSTGPFESSVMHIRTKASTAIKIYTAAGTFTSATYNAEGVIRQLQ